MSEENEILTHQLQGNNAHADKYFVMFNRIPSTPLLIKEDIDQIERQRIKQGGLEFFRLSLKSFELPGWSIGEEKLMQMMGAPTTHSTNIHDFSDFTTTFQLDSKYTLYKLLWLWMMQVNNPQTANEFHGGEAVDVTQVNMSLFVRDNFNSKIPVMGFEFYDIWPKEIPPISFDYTTEGEPIEFPVTWGYSHYMPITGTSQKFNIHLEDFGP